MNFFESQAKARKKTKLLVLLYFISVALIIGFIYLALLVVFQSSIESQSLQLANFKIWRPELFFAVAGIVTALVVTGSGYKILQLRSGGSAVASSLNGRLLMPNTTAPDERRILNIVEEVALASGISIPQVYLLDQENSINAFAAGYNPNQAVIGVSRGCLEQLTRDELQGVVAHEFSHILNGDMRLNIRLIGILHGILILVLTGRIILHAGLRGSRGRNNKNSGSPFILVGVVVLVVGGIGAFAARLIKMAVSRQREYLADASAVQFTRSPWGIAGALKKIGASVNGAKLSSNKAEEISHMCFANALSGWFSTASLFATHPPLLERIRAVEPGFDGNFESYAIKHDQQQQPVNDRQKPGFPQIPGMPNIPGINAISSMVGLLSAESLQQSAQTKASLPEALVSACHEPLDATALVCSLLMRESSTPLDQQLQFLRPMLPVLVTERLEKLLIKDLVLPVEQRLCVLEMSLASIRYLSLSQYLQVKSAIRYLIDHDQHVSVFEYALYKIFTHNLDQHFESNKTRHSEQTDLSKIVTPTADLLFTLSNFSSSDTSHADIAFNKACDLLGIHQSIRLEVTKNKQPVSIIRLDLAMNSVSNVAPAIRQKIFEACLVCIQADGEINYNEFDIIRALGAVLECPIPAMRIG